MNICYLCGNTIVADRSTDHLPPKQFYAASLRRDLNLSKLQGLPAHGECNKSIGHDEEYFAWTLVPLAAGSIAADALIMEHAQKFRKGSRVGLGKSVLSEFERRPSGLHLPRGIVLKRVQGPRVSRVIWKLTRGLYFQETGTVLPDDTPYTYEMIEPVRAAKAAGENPVWEAVKAQTAKGSYGGVFEYKYLVSDIDGEKLHTWGMLVWDRLMFFVAHHEPVECPQVAVQPGR